MHIKTLQKVFGIFLLAVALSAVLFGTEVSISNQGGRTLASTSPLAYPFAILGAVFGALALGLYLFVLIATMARQSRQHQSGWFSATLLLSIFGLIAGSIILLPFYLFLPKNHTPAARSPRFGPALHCPYCFHSGPVQIHRRVSRAGWITFVIIACFTIAFCWIGLFIREDYYVCNSCGLKLGS